MKVQVMTIKTHTESSKSELSSRGKRPFKVFRWNPPSWDRAEPARNPRGTRTRKKVVGPPPSPTYTAPRDKVGGGPTIT